MAKKQPSKPTTKPKPLKKEGNIYDKIFKEVIEKIVRPLVEQRLGIKIVKATPLKEKMQTTIEREMDFAKIALLADVSLAFVQQVKDERPAFVAVSDLLLNTKLKDAKIGLSANVTLEFVKKVRLILAQ